MSPIKDLVMPHETVVRKLDRMAREMLEIHYNESTLVLIGVDGQGLAVAGALARRHYGHRVPIKLNLLDRRYLPVLMVIISIF